MRQRLIAGLVVIGLAVGIWLLWPEGEGPGASATTSPGDVSESASVPSAPPTIAPIPSTTEVATTGDGAATVTTQEAEAILRELWFGWFEGIYNQDEDRIREVVATEEQIDLAKAQFDEMTFVGAPSRDGIAYTSTRVLAADSDCLVISTTAQLSEFVEGTTSDVHVLRQKEGEWRLFSLWKYEEDLWQDDCVALLTS